MDFLKHFFGGGVFCIPLAFSTNPLPNIMTKIRIIKCPTS